MGFGKPGFMKGNPIELHRICKAYTYESGLHRLAKPARIKGIPTGLHRIDKACTYER